MIHVEVNHSDLERVKSKLKGHEEDAPKALRDAVNDTATHARKLLAEAAQQRYTVKKGGFNKAATIKKATLANPTAEIRANGAMLSLLRFHTTAPKSGVKAEVIKGGGLKLVRENGNKAFSGKGKRKLNNMVYVRAGKSRVPLMPQYSNSVPKMLEKVYVGRRATDGLKDQIEQNYQHNVNRQIERFLNS